MAKNKTRNVSSTLDGKDGHAIAIYSKKRCVALLMKRDGMDEEEADEFFEYNIRGAHVGEHTPMFVEDDSTKGDD